MKKINKVIGILLALFMLMQSMTAPSLAADAPPTNTVYGTVKPNVILRGKCSDNAEFTLSDDMTLEISGSGKIYKYNNSSNLAPWAEHRMDIKRLIINEGITYTDIHYVFAGSEITNVIIGDGVETIGEYAFYPAPITDIKIGKSVISIDNGALGEFVGNKVVFPASVSKLGWGILGSRYDIFAKTDKNALDALLTDAEKESGMTVNIGISAATEASSLPNEIAEKYSE